MSRLHLLWRKSLNILMLTLTGVAALLVVSVLFLILGCLLWNGGKSLNLSFFTQLPKPVGESGGGMANAIVGSLKLLLLAAVLGLPVGLLAGVYLAEFGGKTFSFVIRYTTDILNGVPSVVIGIFAYTLAVLPVKHFSTFAGGVALGVMAIPITVRSTEEFLRAVPGTPPRGRHGSRREQMAYDCDRGAASSEGRYYYWHAAGPGARRRRDCPTSVHGSRKPVLESRMESAHRIASNGDLCLCVIGVRRLAPASMGCGAGVAGPGSCGKRWHAAGSESWGSRTRCLIWPPPHKARNLLPQS